jgi:predicted lipid-binding transport protein (Tim44 family)
MDTGFSYGDIIVIGAIAAFILLRYRAMLGSDAGRDVRPQVKPVAASEYERVIQLSAKAVATPSDKKEDFSKHYGSLSETFVAMRGIDREFTPDEFLQGARAAYEMVIEAFTKADRDTLKMLLSDTIYKEFDEALAADQAAARKAETTLVAIKTAAVSDATLSGNAATITVDFLSEQVHLVRDLEGTIIEGDASREEKVEDRWVFTRILTSTDYNWKIIET